MSPVKKPKFQRRFGFTDQEVKVLKALAMYHSIKGAAKVLHMKVGTVKSTLFRIRLRFEKATEFLEQYHKWKKEMPRGKYL